MKSKKDWINPELQTFGAVEQQSSGQSSSPAMFGQNCGASVVRYGAQCGIRTGQACLPRIGTACLTRIGTQCLPRVGTSCTVRLGTPCGNRVGTECGALPDEPLPPK